MHALFFEILHLSSLSFFSYRSLLAIDCLAPIRYILQFLLSWFVEFHIIQEL